MSTRTIGELAKDGALEFGDGYRTKRSELASTGYRIIRVADITDGQIDLSSADFVSSDLVRAIGTKSAQQGDVLLTTKGTVGRVAVVTSLDEKAVYSPQLCYFRVKPNRHIDPRYLALWLRSPNFMRQADDRKDNTDMAAYINLADIRSLQVPLPPLPEQQAIAEVLGALDDKITANTKLAEGADRFIRAEFLGLPSERNIALSELAAARREQVDPTEVRADLQYVGLEHIPRRSMWLADQGYASDVTSAKSRFRSGDVLFGKLRPYFHKVVSASSDGICSTDVIVVTACQAALQGAVLAAVSSDAVVEAVTSMSEGTRMPRTSWKDLASVEVPWPNDLVAQQFSDRVVGIRGAVESKLRENRTLAATRDALLPQLMSGKLRVRDAEQLASEIL